MDGKTLLGVLELLGLVTDKDSPFSFETIIADAAKGVEESSLVQAAGETVAVWYSVFGSPVEIVVIAPQGRGYRMRYTHPGTSTAPSSGMLWESLSLALSSVGAAMALERRVRSAHVADALREAHKIASRIARLSPSPEPPWTDTPRIGTFEVSNTYRTRPTEAICNVLETAYRRARYSADARNESIRAVVAALRERGMLFEEDIKGILGPRTYNISIP